MKRFFVLTAVFVVLVSMGYAASPLVNTFMDPDIPAADHAVLSVDNNLAIATIDGQMTLKSSGSGSDGLIVSKTPIVLLTPGEHIIDVQYVKRTSEYSYWNNTTRITTTTTNFIKLTGNFEGGRFYRIYPRVEGKNVYFNIIDETDPAVWENERERAAAVKRRATEQKELAKAKYPKKTAALIVFQKAA
ncbi:MAG: hypothetical protein LBC31_09840, partial [Treponema sp.]|nr:hypothetical protein [Treponema sp.]